MSNDRAGFDDWVNAITRPVIGLLLGLALGYITELAIGGSYWLAIIMCVVGAIIWFGLHFIEKLNDVFFNRLFGWPSMRPTRADQMSSGRSWPALVGRYGLIVGVAVGCLAVFVLPQSMLDLLL